MKVFVFDLDDTLYEEIAFVKSGFASVAAHMSQAFGVSKRGSFDLMCTLLEQQGRGSIFNEMLRSYGLETKRNVRQCLSVYRLHSPSISLAPDADAILTQLKESPIYIVTDGHKLVQHNKLTALGLYPRVSKCYITYRYGRHRSKPSPYCFQKIVEAERVHPSDLVYVGDNPNKDFVGIKPLGFRTVRIRRGSYKHLQKPPEYNADIEIDSLSELLDAVRLWGVQGC